ncbi:MAG: tRNA (guanosine(37)-N1)-methyltransferase TrmD [bacterium]
MTERSGTGAELTLDVITIFPEYLAPLRQSLVGKAIERRQVDLRVHDLRRWTDDVHHTVDGPPYGGGPGMVMRPEPWGRALDDVAPVDHSGNAAPVLVIPTPTGVPFTQAVAAELAQRSWLIFACGRYEGIDARVAADAARRLPVLELSLGDYVLAGGEVAVLAMVEATVRLLPGVLGNADSAAQDSFSDGWLEGPAYTRPPTWRGLAVPDVLRSGDHAAIASWRRAEAERLTRERRPDLLRPAD